MQVLAELDTCWYHEERRWDEAKNKGRAAQQAPLASRMRSGKGLLGWGLQASHLVQAHVPGGGYEARCTAVGADQWRRPAQHVKARQA